MTKKILYLVLTVNSLLGLASCASYKGFPDRVVDADVELQSLQEYFNKEHIQKYENSASEEGRRRIRNEIINGRIAAIDIQFSLFQQKLHEEGLNLNVGADAALLGLGAAGALVSGGTSQVLSATSAALTGFRESIDKNAFFEQTMPALFAQMVAQRKRVLAKIRMGLAADSSAYPLQQGLADVQDYQYVGSIPGSIATIVEDAGATSVEATKTLDETFDKVVNFQMDKGAQSLEEYLGPPDAKGNFDQVKTQNIRNCWKKVGVPENTLFVDFIFEPIFEAKREEAVACINKR